MATKGGLGKGLDALIRRTDDELPAPREESVDGATFIEIPVAEIKPNPRQPRTNFDEDALQELVESIKEVGVLQPVVVRKVDRGYELIMGERRLRASKEAGLKAIPAIVRETSDDDMLRDALLENLHRAELNPLEEAAAYEQLLNDFGCTQEELSRRIKRSRPHISNTIRLLRLPAPVQRRVAAGVISAGHARALLTMDDPVQVELLAQRIVAEGLSVRATEEIVALGQKHKETRKRAPKAPHPRAVALSEDLSDVFDTRVRVDIGKNKGQIVIEFAAEDDLDRIMNIKGQLRHE